MILDVHAVWVNGKVKEFVAHDIEGRKIVVNRDVNGSKA